MAYALAARGQAATQPPEADARPELCDEDFPVELIP